MKKTLACPCHNLCKVYLVESGLCEVDKDNFKEFFVDLGEMFTYKPALTDVAWRKINTGAAAPAASKPHRYDKVKLSIIVYHIKKML